MARIAKTKTNAKTKTKTDAKTKEARVKRYGRPGSKKDWVWMAEPILGSGHPVASVRQVVRFAKTKAKTETKTKQSR